MSGLFPGITGDVELDDVETWCYQTAVGAAVPAEILGPGHGFSFLRVHEAPGQIEDAQV